MRDIFNILAKGVVLVFAISFFGIVVIEENSDHPPRLKSFGTLKEGGVLRSTDAGHSASNDSRTHDHGIPPFVGDPNSSFRSPYHRYWETNCSLIFKHDSVAMNAVHGLLEGARGNRDIPMVPPDGDFLKYTQDCQKFKRNRNYPTKSSSEEERNYPIAYLLLVHKEVAQIERLLRAIYQPQNIYCIHPDSRSSLEFQASIRSLASCFDNVFIASKIERVQYGGYSRLQAEINCMKDLLQKPVQWRYLINLCGQDFPLKTNLEIVRQLKAGRDHNFVQCVSPSKTRHKMARTQRHHNTEDDSVPPRQTYEKKRPPPYNFTIYFGNAFNGFTRDFINYTIYDEKAIALLKWSEDTFSPDEFYWATLQPYPGVPGGFPRAYELERNFKFVHWSSDCYRCHGRNGKSVRAVCIFGFGSLRALLAHPLTFANKFHYDYDPVTLQCLEEMLEYRQWYPETIDHYVKGFPITEIDWRNDTHYCPPI